VTNEPTLADVIARVEDKGQRMGIIDPGVADQELRALKATLERLKSRQDLIDSPADRGCPAHW
jgi:hypothetical protein